MITLSKTPLLLRIAEIISSRHGISIYDMFKESRKGQFKTPRFFFCYIARSETDFSYGQIAHFITHHGKRNTAFNHATIIHACKTIAGYIEMYDEYKEEIETIQSLVQNNNQIIVSNVNLLLSCVDE